MRLLEINSGAMTRLDIVVTGALKPYRAYQTLKVFGLNLVACAVTMAAS